MAKERIGILGGTFDPIHLGHLHMAQAAMAQIHLDRVLMVPTGNPPHKSDITPASDRWRMVCAACAQLDGLEPSRIELDREGVTYAVDTLTQLREAYPKADLFYIIGADTLMELHAWRRSDDVLKLCTFIVCPRPGKDTPLALREERRLLTERGGQFMMLDAEVMDISSTVLRQALRENRPTPELPVPVREYCYVAGLYGMTPRVEEGRQWLSRLFVDLNVKRFAHTLSVASTARTLALTHGLDAQKAEIAGLLHDCAKCLPLREMRQLCDRHGVETDKGMRESGALLHAPAGACQAQDVYGVTDKAVLDAIFCHNTGKPDMTPLDMAVWLADKIEPTRAPYPLLDKVRMLSGLSLQKALTTSMEGSCKYIRQRGKTVHPMTLRTLEWLKASAESK